jgi:deoxyribose-phosphate aldolase
VVGIGDALSDAEEYRSIVSSVDLARLVDLITAEVLASLGQGDARGHGHGHGLGEHPAQCACHGVIYECCPARVRGLLDAGATRLGLHAAGGRPGDVAALIDHTLLKPEATRAEIETLCREAAEFRFATVCINPTWVSLAARLLRGAGVGVCTVVGFPLGATTADVKQYETRRVIFDGATEVDMVINIGALKSGDVRTVERDIEAVASTCRDANVLSKVIIEAALLTDEEKVIASTHAKAAGADYVKTSTGFAKSGATPDDVALMRRVVGPEMGVKAAGGVRDYEQLKAMQAAGATRVGASAGVKIVQQARGEQRSFPATIRT